MKLNFQTSAFVFWKLWMLFFFLKDRSTKQCPHCTQSYAVGLILHGYLLNVLLILFLIFESRTVNLQSNCILLNRKITQTLFHLFKKFQQLGALPAFPALQTMLTSQNEKPLEAAWCGSPHLSQAGFTIMPVMPGAPTLSACLGWAASVFLNWPFSPSHQNGCDRNLTWLWSQWMWFLWQGTGRGMPTV